MRLTADERAMLEGGYGPGTRKAMEILVGLGRIYGARRMVAVSSVQVAGVSYDNLGEAGLQFLESLAVGGARARVLATLNPAGCDIANWQALGISQEFFAKQSQVLEAYRKMAITTTCSCTPYLFGNLPHFGEHVAWAESSAVVYANAVLGARTNREGGPSALAAALTGRTPCYGYHLEENRHPDVRVHVKARFPRQSGGAATHEFGALGQAIGRRLEKAGKKVPYIEGIESASLEELKAFCASLATYGGVALFHLPGITPEAGAYPLPEISLTVTRGEIDALLRQESQAPRQSVDFLSLGCPHLSLREIAHLAELLRGQVVRREFWITTSRPVKRLADEMGFTEIIAASGAKFAVDTCCVVAPIRGRFKVMATDSAKACYYGYAKNDMHTLLLPIDELVVIATSSTS